MATLKYSGTSTGENIVRDFVAAHRKHITKKVQKEFTDWYRDQEEEPAIYQIEDWFLDKIEEII